MAAIAFPTTGRDAYTPESPWTDASGNQWSWDDDKTRWSPVAAGTSLTAGTGIDITGGVVSSTLTRASLSLATTDNVTFGTVAAATFTGALTGTASGNLVAGGALGTPSSGTLTNCTFPTLNQNTSGNAATVTTNANLTGHVTSVGNATVLGSFTLAQLDAATSDATLARTDAGQTFAGAQTFSDQVQLAGQAATDANSAMSRGLADARYGVEYIQIIASAVEAVSTSFVNGPDLVLPAGTYDFELFGLLEIAGETSGGDLNFRCSPATDVTTAIETRLANVNALGTAGTASSSFRKGAVLNAADQLGTTYVIAPNNYGSVQTRGTTVLASETTVSFRVKQRVTDASNPAKLAVGSFIKFTKR